MRPGEQKPAVRLLFGSRFAIYGVGRARWMFPAKSYFENGIVVGAGSDSASASLNPWLGISAATWRRDRKTGQIISLKQRIGVLQALDMYRRNAASLECEEGKEGSLESGDLADFIVVDQDVLSISP